MFNKITAIIVSITTVVLTLTGWGVKVKAPDDDTDFTPVLRFVACSDSHVDVAVGVPTYRLEKTLKLAYAIAEADESYTNLDAFMINGDITNDGTVGQYSGFKAVMQKYLRSETQLLPIIHKNHDFRTMDSATVDYFSNLMGDDTDYHKVINGYHFIGISSPASDDGAYTEDQRVWLKEQLDEAVADDPNKPIFVSQHEHISNTVYGSSDFDGWGTDYFTDILEQYPQVVDFSGHSHYPINDPRSVWQGNYTAIGTGALRYLEFTVDNSVRTYHPTGYTQEAEFWIVELDEDSNIRLRGIDLIEQKVLCEYILANPADTANREYTPEKQAEKSVAPVFSDSAAIKVTKAVRNVSVKFDAAQSANSEPITLYRVTVTNTDGEEVKSDWVLPKYYSATVEKYEKLNLGSFKKGTYIVSVTAETAWGVQSEPIATSFTIK